jgi:shikimate dehydrogenase
MIARRACVIGHPVAHSRSPAIHKYWLAEHGIVGDYGREDVAPAQIAKFLARFADSGYVGANVTVPHKEAAFAAAEADAVAYELGAVNTLWLDGRQLLGTNTDVHGFLANLDEQQPGWERGTQSAVVLGAGGAARAVVYALLHRGAERVTVANRTFEKAEAFRARFGERVHPVRWNEVNGLLAGAHLLANATSLGMIGQPELDISVSDLPPSAIVTDIVYVPLETPLLAAARKRGLRTADGLGMLLHQAVRGFSLWFGVRPVVTAELRGLVEADLKSGATAEK